VDDACALDVPALALAQESSDSRAGDRDGHAVEVQFGIDRQFAASQFAHRPLLPRSRKIGRGEMWRRAEQFDVVGIGLVHVSGL